MGSERDEMPAHLVEFFERMQDSRMSFHDFGADWAFILRRIGNIFAQQIGEDLQATFQGRELAIPVAFVARSMAGVYVSVFQWWIMEQPVYTAAEMAAYTHRMMDGVISAALAQQT